MLAKEILGIKTPEKLFPNDPEEVKKKYRFLSKAWHPDVCKDPEAQAVFEHINELYQLASNKINNRAWGYQGRLIVRNAHGAGGWSLQYHTKQVFELGEMYAGDHTVVYLIDSPHRRKAQMAEKLCQSLTYANDKMKKECQRYLPHLIETMIDSEGHSSFAVRNKTPDLVLLRDVLNHYGGSLDPKHVAWIISSLCNLSCYLSYAGVAHQDISLDTYFISPEHHSGALLGGWWYGSKIGETIESLPVRTYSHLPWAAKKDKKAIHTTDLELIRLVGRELLGDGSGKNLRADTPKPMADWLKEVVPEEDDAAYNYRNWIEVLGSSFGARRFTVMDLNEKTLYQ